MSKLRSANFGFTTSEDGVTIYCEIDTVGAINTGSAADCTDGYMYGNLSLGSHTVRAQAYDAAGNASSIIAYTWAAGLLARGGNVSLSPTIVHDFDYDGQYEFVSSDMGSYIAVQPVTSGVINWSVAVGGAMRGPVVGPVGGIVGDDLVFAYAGGITEPIVAHDGITGARIWQTTDIGYMYDPTPEVLLTMAQIDTNGLRGVFIDTGSGLCLIRLEDGVRQNCNTDYYFHSTVSASTVGGSSMRVVGSDGTALMAIANAPTMTTLTQRLLPSATNGIVNSEFVDFNGDGTVEVLTFIDGAVWLLNGNDLSTIWAVTVATDNPGYASVVDINADGYMDVVQNWDQDVAVAGSPGVLAAISGADGSVIWEQAIPALALNTLVFDVDGDTTPDVVYAEMDVTADTLQIVARDGLTGALIDTIAVPSADTALLLGYFGYAYPSAGDYDSDGLTDIAVNTGRASPDGVWIIATDWPAPASYPWPTLRRTNARNGWGP